MKMTGLRPVLLVGMAAVSGMAQASTVVYDNITGSAPTYGGAGLGYNPSLSNLSAVVGVAFTPTVSGYISGLETSIVTYTGSAVYDLGVYDNVNGSPGSLLETLAVSANSPSVSNQGPLTSTTFGSGATLSAGQTYWLVAGVGSSVPNGGWYGFNLPTATPFTWCSGSTPGTGTGSLSSCARNSGVTGYQYGLQVSMASPVPVPAAAWLMLSGLSGLGTFARRKRAAYAA